MGCGERMRAIRRSFSPSEDPGTRRLGLSISIWGVFMSLTPLQASTWRAFQNMTARLGRRCLETPGGKTVDE